MGAHERGFTPQHGHPRLCHALLGGGPETRYEVTLALAHPDHIDRDRAGVHAVLSRTAHQMRDARAGSDRLGRCAAHIDTGAAHIFPLHQRRLPTHRGQLHRQRLARLACPNNHRIIMLDLVHPVLPQDHCPKSFFAPASSIPAIFRTSNTCSSCSGESTPRSNATCRTVRPLQYASLLISAAAS